MFCYNCGNKIGEEDHYCQNCGAKQKTAEIPLAPNTAPVMNAVPVKGPVEKQIRLKGGIVVGIAAVLIAVAALLAMRGIGKEKSNEGSLAADMGESADKDFSTPATAPVTSVDYEDIPQTLTELFGYRPYVIRFLLNGNPSGDFVPYFNVDGQLLDMEEAENMGYIKNVQTYRTDGVPCKLMTVVDKNTGAVELTHNAVFTFYVKQGAEMLMYPASSADLMHYYGNLFELYSHYSAAEVEQKGWGASALRYTLEPGVDFNEEGTVMLIDCELDSYRTKLWDGNAYTIEHYFHFYKKFNEKETPAGSM